MNTKAMLFAILTGLSATTGLQAEDTNVFKSDKEKVGYAVGVNLGTTWKRQDIDLDFDQLLRGLKDATSGSPMLTEPEVREVLTKFQQEMMAKQQEKRRLEGEKNKQEGEKFLAENKTKPGVITLTNGLQYKVLTDGTGDIPKPEDTVTVNYRGTFIDGNEFDSSAKAGRPYTTRVTGGVIRGWTEALTRMKVGSKWQLFIPPDLAYGEMGRGSIPPNTALLFEVELISIQPPPPPVQSTPLTSDIIKVPSLEEMKKGAKIETIKAEDVEKLVKEQQKQTNAPPRSSLP
jgi:FKBP-type peptidyl-prolyl cis-trans isomerase FklB